VVSTPNVIGFGSEHGDATEARPNIGHAPEIPVGRMERTRYTDGAWTAAEIDDHWDELTDGIDTMRMTPGY
jgi:hypothetical protein